MYQKLFIEAGLIEGEAEVYEYLLSHGESTAAEIIKNTSLKKGMCYVMLENLENKGLLIKTMSPPKNPQVKNKGKIAYFMPEHPNKLKQFIENKEAALKAAKNNLDANLVTLSSTFNKVSGQPGIQVFEGKEGLRTALKDILKTKSLVRTITELDSLTQYVNDINTEHALERDKLGIQKKILIIDTPFARKELSNYLEGTTDIRFFAPSDQHITSGLQLYDNKTMYINFSPTGMITTIIQDPELYKLNIAMFDAIWDNNAT
jgi:sugar-specific transcriptional regulator TrmB